MMEDFVDNKVIPTVTDYRERQDAKKEDYNEEYSPPPASRFGRQKVAKGYGQKTKAFRTLANAERDASEAFEAASSNTKRANDSPSSTSSSSIDDPGVFSPSDKSLKAIQHREKIRAKIREREQRSFKKKRKATAAVAEPSPPSPPHSPPSPAPATKKKLKLSSPDASTPLNASLSNSVLNDPIQDSDDDDDDEEEGSVSSGSSGPRRLNFGSSSKKQGALKSFKRKNVRFVDSDDEALPEETEEAKQAKLHAKSKAALDAMLGPTSAPSSGEGSTKERIMEKRRLMQLEKQKKKQQSPFPARTKMPLNPYVKSSSSTNKNFVRSSGSSLFKTTIVRTGGLTNIGNSCYMNAVVQCLLSIPSFVKEMKGEELKKVRMDEMLKE